jgi:hypothetical protein
MDRIRQNLAKTTFGTVSVDAASWLPVPEQLSVLIWLHIAHCANTNTGANAESR